MIPSSSLQFLKKSPSFSPKPLLSSISYQLGLNSCSQILEDCILFKIPPLGYQIHSKIIVSGFANDSFLSTKLINFYSLCRDIPSAIAVFELFPTCNVYLLNSMIRGYSSNGLCQEAINLFRMKRGEGIIPDSYTFSCVLKACTSALDLRQGIQLHQLAVESGFGADIFVSNSLVLMYAKCGSLEDGLHVFDEMPHRDVVSWNSVMLAFAWNGFDFDAAEKVREMIGSGLKPDQVTIISILAFCSAIDTVVREVHGFVLKNGMEALSMIQNAMISAYGKCGMIEKSQMIFNSLAWKDRVSWNAIIASYSQNGLFEDSFKLLKEMKNCRLDFDVVTYSGIISSLTQNNLSYKAMAVFEELLSSGLNPDVVAIASVLPSISGIFCLDYCKEIHGYSFRHGLEADRRVRNALVSVYSKCGSVRCAEQVFEAIEDRDVISWSSMIVGYSQNHNLVKSLDTFREMMIVKMVPNPVTITSALSATAGVSGLRLGKELHLWAIKNSFQGQPFVGSALIDMYAKCGRIRSSRSVFDLMEEKKNLVSWNSMIGGYAIHGMADNALEIFGMVADPDDVSFIAALSACCHGGLVEEGIQIFRRMKEFKLTPRESHYACVVDLLARSGRVDGAFEFVRTMPAPASAETWGVLLGACKVHSNLEVGIYTGEQIIESGSLNSGYHVLISNVLAEFGMWGEVEEMRRRMAAKGVRKRSGCSWIEVNRTVSVFVAKEGEQHPEWELLFRVLSFLTEQMKGMYF